MGSAELVIALGPGAGIFPNTLAYEQVQARRHGLQGELALAPRIRALGAQAQGSVTRGGSALPIHGSREGRIFHA